MNSSSLNEQPIVNDPAWFQDLSACIASTGSAEFTAHFFSMITRLVSIEQCMIFTYHTDDHMSCVMAENVASPEVAKALANDYVSGEFKKDPNFATIKGALENDNNATHTLPADDQHMAGEYGDHFFKGPHLIDKVSLTAVSNGTCYYINLYRGKAKGKFADKEVSALNVIAPVITTLVLKHFSEEAKPVQPETDSSNTILSNLSGRERQICEFILRGYTLKTLAAELGISETSAATYRKRAYQKLGIPSKGKLVALFQSQQTR